MMFKPSFRKSERGMALIIALLLLLLVSAVGLGMIYMSSTETTINTNYRDTQTAFFAMRAGLEEMRERMRTSANNAIALPTTAMPGTAGSVTYILNPSSASDVIDPKSASNQYFDDEFCHESFVGSGVTYVAPGAGTCTTGLSSASVTTVTSVDPNTNTSSSLKYKWVRLTLKQNGTFPSAIVDPTQTGANLASQVCWNSSTSQEVVASALGYANCTAASNAGLTVEPVYLVTSLAITPLGSRRVGQYESAAYNITPPPGALALDGPAAVFNPTPSSSQYFANGTNSGDPANSNYTAFTGPGPCASTLPALTPAISTGDAVGVTGIDASLLGPPDRTGNYTGSGPTPSVVNEGATGGNQFGGTWSSPPALDSMVQMLANGADKTYSCAIGTPCTGTGPYGTDAAPQITYVSGDFNFGNASGAGVLVVTGTLNITGDSSFDGLILVIGQGKLVESGGGHGQFNGSVFLANTKSPTSPYSELATLGSPQIAWNGGGTNGIQFNSCWADIGNTMHYMVVASREEMY